MLKLEIFLEFTNTRIRNFSTRIENKFESQYPTIFYKFVKFFLACYVDTDFDWFGGVWGGQLWTVVRAALQCWEIKRRWGCCFLINFIFVI